MPQTSIVNSSKTECNNGECVQITTSCVDGDCTERRIVVNEQRMVRDFEQDTGPQGAQWANRLGGRNNYEDDTDTDTDTDTSSEGGSDNGCEDYKQKTVAILFSGIDITIPSILLSLIMIVLFMVGIFKMKKKK